MSVPLDTSTAAVTAVAPEATLSRLLGKSGGSKTAKVRLGVRKRPRPAQVKGAPLLQHGVNGTGPSSGEDADLSFAFGAGAPQSGISREWQSKGADVAPDLDALLAELAGDGVGAGSGGGVFSAAGETISFDEVVGSAPAAPTSSSGASTASAAAPAARTDADWQEDEGAEDGSRSVLDALLRREDGSNAASDVPTAETAGSAGETAKPKATGRFLDEEANDEDEEAVVASRVAQSSGGMSVLDELRERTAKKVAPKVDHAAAGYAPFRKQFLIEAAEMCEMSHAQVSEVRRSLRIAVRGKNPPRPVRTWAQAGLNSAIQTVLESEGYKEPFAIQRQAIPAIMAGRDVMAVAKTGSGKTLAFVAPLLRHVNDQPRLEFGETGPIALVLAPTRELVTQLYSEVRKFAKPLGLAVVPLYGGSNVGAQVSQLRRRAHVVIGTPGRTLDMLGMNGGRAMSLKRCTMLCLDEADRMFDLGFEPQVKAIAARIRPDRQTIMFSATFPKRIAEIARAIVNNPVEITVGGRSVVSDTIEQFVEVRSEESKFPRLLQLLGAWADKGSALVFVSTKERADDVLLQLLRVGYSGMSIHGGKEQDERDETIAEFKRGDTKLLVATSIACRGLDVKHLRLVVNYDVPTHLEDYIHRVGRTGRAERKGTAFTFITPDEGQYAHDLRKALADAGQAVPEALATMAETHDQAVKAGTAKKRRSGYTSRGNVQVSESGAMEDKQAALDALLTKKRAEHQQGIITTDELIAAEDEIEEQRAEGKAKRAKEEHVAEAAATASASSLSADADANAGASADTGSSSSSSSSSSSAAAAAAEDAAKEKKRAVARKAIAIAKAKASLAALRGKAVAAIARAAVDASQAAKAQEAKEAVENAEQALLELTGPPDEDKARAIALAAVKTLGLSTTDEGEDDDESESLDFVINDYPAQARRRILSREVSTQIAEWYGCAIVTKGVYVAPGKRPPEGKARLTLTIQGPTLSNVRRAQAELRRTLDEVTAEVGVDRDALQYGKYNIQV